MTITNTTRAGQKLATRERILAAARNIAGRQGLNSRTVSQVARQAGVAVGTVFLHFPTLGSLAEVLLDEHIAATLGEAFATLPKGKPLRRLAHVCDALYDGYARNAELARQCISTSLFHTGADGVSDRRLAEFRTWVLHELREVKAGSDDVKFYLFFSLYFGLLVAGLRGSLNRESQSALLRAGLKQLFGGVRS